MFLFFAYLFHDFKRMVWYENESSAAAAAAAAAAFLPRKTRPKIVQKKVASQTFFWRPPK